MNSATSSQPPTNGLIARKTIGLTTRKATIAILYQRGAPSRKLWTSDWVTVFSTGAPIG